MRNETLRNARHTNGLALARLGLSFVMTTAALACSPGQVNLTVMVEDMKKDGYNVDIDYLPPNDLERLGVREALVIRGSGARRILVIRRDNGSPEPFAAAQAFLGTELIGRSAIDLETEQFLAYRRNDELFNSEGFDAVLRALRKSYLSRTPKR